MFAQLVVEVCPELQRVEPFGLVGAVVLECLDMEETRICTQRPFPADVEILSQPIEHRPREVFVEPHVVGAEADDAVGAAVSEAEGGIEFGARPSIHHDVNVGLGVDIHQTYLVGHGVAAVVHDAYLHAPGVVGADVQEANLRTVECVGIVVGTNLQTPHV